MASTGARHFASPDETVGALDASVAARLVAAVSDVALVVDEQGIILDVSVTDTDSPIESRDWIGQPWVDTVTVESRPKILELLEEADEGTAGRWRQVNYAANAGPDVPIIYSAVRIKRSGTVLAVGRDLRDIASVQQRLVQAQQAMEQDYARLRSAEMRYRLLFRDVDEAVIVVDALTENVVEANPAASELIGLPEQALTGRELVSLFDSGSAEAIRALLTGTQTAGRADGIRVDSPADGEPLRLSASLFRQQQTAYYLIRLLPESSPRLERSLSERSNRLSRVVDSIPDGFVVTDADGSILVANQAFLDMVQLTTETSACGESLERWLCRPGVDFTVIRANLRQNGSVRLYTTQLRGDLGSTTTVELSAVRVDNKEAEQYGFVLRDVDRRIESSRRVIGEHVPRSVEDLTELIGQVPLREIVKQTTDLIERLCIEAALRLTRDNRASAAEMLGMSRQALYTKLRRYGVGDLESADEN